MRSLSFSVFRDTDQYKKKTKAMSGSDVPRYISQPELAELLTNKSTSQTTAVVDCRDDDRIEGGWVRGSIHFPSKRATPDAYAQLLASLTHSGIKRVVFHCMFSQARGPTGARKFVSLFPVQARGGLEVLILEGGMQGFFRWADANQRMELVERSTQCFL
jgi:hypothetical protein